MQQTHKQTHTALWTAWTIWAQPSTSKAALSCTLRLTEFSLWACHRKKNYIILFCERLGSFVAMFSTIARTALLGQLDHAHSSLGLTFCLCFALLGTAHLSLYCLPPHFPPKYRHHRQKLHSTMIKFKKLWDENMNHYWTAWDPGCTDTALR